MLTKKIALAAASAMLVTTVAFATNARPAYAAAKVDCDAVMNEVNSGKKAKEIATDLSISTSSVYRCKRHAKEAAKASTKSSIQAKSGNEPPMAPGAMSAPSPAMAAPAAAASPK
jgi:FixJ family two-component response regulator